MYVYIYIEARSSNHYYSAKAINITYSECVSVTLVTQHAKSMHHIVLLSVAYLDPQYVSPFYQKLHYFRGKKFEHKLCFDFLYFCLKHFFSKKD